jgi:hypothetical protein
MDPLRVYHCYYENSNSYRCFHCYPILLLLLRHCGSFIDVKLGEQGGRGRGSLEDELMGGAIERRRRRRDLHHHW